jgi:hypothetical protein
MNADIPLVSVEPGMFLLLGDDPLLEPRMAAYLFYEPQRVISVHRERTPHERPFLLDGAMIVRATGWEDRVGQEIGVAMTGPSGGTLFVLFPDDRHLVSAVNLPEPLTIPGAIPVGPQLDRDPDARPVMDPATGQAHDGRDLSAYGLPALWRDASVIWSTLPASWFGRGGRHSELLLFEARSGLRSPSSSDIRAFEELFCQDITIGTATLCWENATVVQCAHDENLRLIVDPLLDPLLEPSLRRLLAAYGSPAALRSAGLEFVDARLVQAGVEQAYLDTFFSERSALAVEIASQAQKEGLA